MLRKSLITMCFLLISSFAQATDNKKVDSIVAYINNAALEIVNLETEFKDICNSVSKKGEDVSLSQCVNFMGALDLFSVSLINYKLLFKALDNCQCGPVCSALSVNIYILKESYRQAQDALVYFKNEHIVRKGYEILDYLKEIRVNTGTSWADQSEFVRTACPDMLSQMKQDGVLEYILDK